MNNLLAWLIRIPLALLGLALFLALGLLIAYLLSDRLISSLVSSGVKRFYRLYVPKTYDPAAPAPLVFVIHGFAEWPAHQMRFSRWNDLADQYGFIMVYPSGTGLPKRWRIFGEPGGDEDPMLEVAFISDLIDKMESQFNIDPARIYVNGFSNGGGLSYVLSCKMSGRIAAIGSVAGAYLLPETDCRPVRSVPVILFHGTEDRVVPYQGGPSRPFKLPFPPVPEWVDALARQNGCTSPAQTLPARGEVSGVQYTDSTSNPQVVFYTITGGGHAWPGARRLPGFIAGHTTRDIDATRTMWDFFQQHTLPVENENPEPSSIDLR